VYLKIVNDVAIEYSLSRLKADNPTTSFPDVLTDELLENYSVFRYQNDPIPSSYDSLTQNVEFDEFYQDGELWKRTCEVSNKPLSEAEENMRVQRTNLLNETDWMALSDSTLTPEWALYRQSLRDLSQQAGWPYDIEWPSKPE
jgi:hypothetical protein